MATADIKESAAAMLPYMIERNLAPRRELSAVSITLGALGGQPLLSCCIFLLDFLVGLTGLIEIYKERAFNALSLPGLRKHQHPFYLVHLACLLPAELCGSWRQCRYPSPHV